MKMQELPLPNFFLEKGGDTNVKHKRQSCNHEYDYDHRQLATVVEFSEDWSSGMWSPAWTHTRSGYNAFGGAMRDVLYTPVMSSGQLKLEAKSSCYILPKDGMAVGVE